MSLTSSDQAPLWSIVLRTEAIPVAIPTIRTVGADLAMRADFDLDSIDDIRMAVDEACATLVRLAAPEAALSCTFAILAERIELDAEVEAADPTAVPVTNSFSWRVLEMLTDEIRVQFVPGAEGRPGRVRIQLAKNSLPPWTC